MGSQNDVARCPKCRAIKDSAEARCTLCGTAGGSAGAPSRYPSSPSSPTSSYSGGSKPGSIKPPTVPPYNPTRSTTPTLRSTPSTDYGSPEPRRLTFWEALFAWDRAWRMVKFYVFLFFLAVWGISSLVSPEKSQPVARTTTENTAVVSASRPDTSDSLVAQPNETVKSSSPATDSELVGAYVEELGQRERKRQEVAEEAKKQMDQLGDALEKKMDEAIAQAEREKRPDSVERQLELLKGREYPNELQRIMTPYYDQVSATLAWIRQTPCPPACQKLAQLYTNFCNLDIEYISFITQDWQGMIEETPQHQQRIASLDAECDAQERAIKAEIEHLKQAYPDL